MNKLKIYSDKTEVLWVRRNIDWVNFRFLFSSIEYTLLEKLHLQLGSTS